MSDSFLKWLPRWFSRRSLDSQDYVHIVKSIEHTVNLYLHCKDSSCILTTEPACSTQWHSTQHLHCEVKTVPKLWRHTVSALCTQHLHCEHSTRIARTLCRYLWPEVETSALCRGCARRSAAPFCKDYLHCVHNTASALCTQPPHYEHSTCKVNTVPAEPSASALCPAAPRRACASWRRSWAGCAGRCAGPWPRGRRRSARAPRRPEACCTSERARRTSPSPRMCGPPVGERDGYSNWYSKEASIFKWKTNFNFFRE